MIKRRTVRPQLRVRETSEADDTQGVQTGSADEDEDKALPCVRIASRLSIIFQTTFHFHIGFPNSLNFASYANRDRESIFINSLKAM